jgi:hypothetical protein
LAAVFWLDAVVDNQTRQPIREEAESRG